MLFIVSDINLSHKFSLSIRILGEMHNYLIFIFPTKNSNLLLTAVVCIG